jgi:hypothetical protein
MRKTILAAVFLLAWGMGWADGAGTSAAAFLRLQADPRAAALGGCESLLDNSASVFAANPSSLARQTRPVLAASHLSWIEGTGLDAAAFSLPAEAHHPGWGLSLATFSSGDIPLTRETPQGDLDPYATGTFSTSETCLRLAAGLPMAVFGRPLLGLGGGLVFLRQNLAGDSSSGLAGDLGLRYDDPLGFVSLGLALQNLGASLGPDALPLQGRLGARVLGSFTRAKDAACYAEAAWQFNQQSTAGVGVEWSTEKYFTARLGYVFNSDLQSLTAGIGLVVPFGFLDLALDYCYCPLKYFGSAQWLGAACRF